MPLSSFLRLLALAAIWGASFLFTRVAVPSLGPVLLNEFRVGLAALFLLLVTRYLHRPLYAGQHWRHYLMLGVFNVALPFVLFGYAALTLTASTLSILNATTPIWGALIAALWLRQPLSRRAALGLVLGVAGVGMIVGLDRWTAQPDASVAIAAALLATVCYGIATNYAKRTVALDSYANAHGSMWAATLVIVPALPFAPAATMPGTGIALAVVALGVVCTGIAFLLYFRLVRDIGPTSTLTVTFLIPAFGILWGHLFLNEPVTLNMIAGTLVVLAGTALATGFNPAKLLGRRAAS